ncbi:MAG: hypothetical protein ACFFAN_02185 [Promethearchaeota archaeon]
MPDLKQIKYQKVIIHDNVEAIYRYFLYLINTTTDLYEKEKLKKEIKNGLKDSLSRYYVFQHNGITFISSGMGSAQTNILVELLKKNDCKAIIKIGTCSALDDNLQEGAIIVPYGAIIDEGATHWRSIKRIHDKKEFFVLKTSNSYKNLRNKLKNITKEYFKKKSFVKCNTRLRQKLIEALKESKYEFINNTKFPNICVWSVDSYDCFDSSPKFYSQLNKEVYEINKFLSKTNPTEKVRIIGVEMECSSLFSSSNSLNIPAAAYIIVSRNRNRLLFDNREFFKVKDMCLNKVDNLEQINEPEQRKIELIHESEKKCFRFSVEILKKVKIIN